MSIGRYWLVIGPYFVQRDLFVGALENRLRWWRGADATAAEERGFDFPPESNAGTAAALALGVGD